MDFNARQVLAGSLNNCNIFASTDRYWSTDKIDNNIINKLIDKRKECRLRDLYVINLSGNGGDANRRAWYGDSVL